MANASIPYIIAEDGFYYVAYKEKVHTPEIVVSAKGVANGLSEEYNDGWDFGPDSYDPTSTANPPYTQTSGIQEAGNYLIANGGGKMFLNGMFFYIDVPIQFLGDVSIEIMGLTKGWYNTQGSQFMGTTILPSSSFSGSQMISYFSKTVNSGSIKFENILFYGNSSKNINGIMTNTVPSGYNQFPQTILRDCKFSWLDTAFNIQGSGGPNILDNVQVTDSITCAVGNASTHITSLELFNTGSSSTPSFQNAGGATNIDNVYIAGALGNWDIVNNAQLNIDTVYISPSSEVGLIQASSGYTNIGTMIIDTMPNIYLFGFDNTTMYVKIHSVLMLLSADYTGLFNYNSSLDYSSSSVSIDNLQVIPNGYTFAVGSLPTDLIPEVKIQPVSLLAPTISANPPVSGTVYQNTNPYAIEIDLPAYASTSGTAGYVTIAKGSTDTPTAIANQYISGDTSSTSTDIIRLRVPAGWYYEFTASGVTFGTASVFAE